MEPSSRPRRLMVMPLVADLMAADVLAVDAGADLTAAVCSMDERRVGVD